MNTMQLACFTEVASTLSFSQAANNLHVSQPTVSHQIKSLEDELGCQLLARSTRSVSLTDEGFALIGYAHDILELSERAKRRLAGAEVVSAKTLRIGVNDCIEAQALSPVLAELRRRDEGFDPVIRMAPHSVLVEMVEDGRLDVVMEYRDPAGAPAGATVFRRLREAPAALVCAADDPLADGANAPVELAVLGDAVRVAVGSPHVLPPAISAMQRELLAHVDPKRVMMCPNIEVILALVSAGIACTLLPDVAALRREGLRFLPVKGVGPAICGVRTRRGRLPKLLSDFIALLA